MSIQMIWKRFNKNDAPLSFAMYLLRFPPINAKPYIKSGNFCTETAVASSTPSNRGVATEFLINKCGLTEEDITKAFRHRTYFLRRAKSDQNMEEVLELLNGCGLTTPAQVRKVILCNPGFLFYKSEINLKPKLSLFRTFMKEEDLAKLLQNGARIFNSSEQRIKSGISVLQKLGIEGKALSDLLVRQPCLLASSEERVMESVKLVEDSGLKRGTKMFAVGLRVISGFSKEGLGRKQELLSSLGFSEKQISELSRKMLSIFGASEEKLKRNADFLVKTAGLPLTDLVKYPELFLHSLETKMIPRYRVLEALKSMQVQEPKRRIKFPRILRLTEKRFLEEYVNSSAESSSVLRKFIMEEKLESESLERRHAVSMSQPE